MAVAEGGGRAVRGTKGVPFPQHDYPGSKISPFSGKPYTESEKRVVHNQTQAANRKKAKKNFKSADNGNRMLPPKPATSYRTQARGRGAGMTVSNSPLARQPRTPVTPREAPTPLAMHKHGNRGRGANMMVPNNPPPVKPRKAPERVPMHAQAKGRGSGMLVANRTAPKASTDKKYFADGKVSITSNPRNNRTALSAAAKRRLERNR